MGSARKAKVVVFCGVLSAAVFAWGAVPAAGQQELEGQRELEELAGLEVEEVVLEGVQRVGESALRRSLATRPSECASVLLTPICWVTDAGLFTDRERFAPEELGRDELRIQVFYWRRGFRHTEVSSRVERKGDGVVVAFEVEEGPATLAESLVLRREPRVLDEERVREVELPREGEPLDVIQLDSATARLRRALRGTGHGDAVVRDTVRLPDSLRARVEITLVPGPVTTIEEVAVRGSERVSVRTIRRLLELEPGERYRPREMSAAQRRLYASDLFHRVMVDVPPGQDSSKRVVVTVQEAPLWEGRGAVGFTTAEFAQVEAGLTRFNAFGGARRIDLRLAVGNLFASQLFGTPPFDAAVPAGVSDDVRDEFLDPTYRVALNYRQPWLFSTRNSLGASVFANRRSIPGVVIDEGYGGSVSLGRELTEWARVDVGYRFERTRVQAGQLYFCANFGICRIPVIDALQGTQRLSPVVLSAAFDATDAPLLPTEGVRVRLEGEVADEATASDYQYLRLQGEVVGYLELGTGTLSVRGRAGWVEAMDGTADALGVSSEFERLLHPRKRFYAGGARSVRGYAENQLGPRVLTVDPDELLDPADTEGCTRLSLLEGRCDPSFLASDLFQPLPLGGGSLVEGSVEYRLPLGGKLLGAAFVDAGWVQSRDIDFPSVSRGDITPGVGLRYLSQAGPVRVDLAVRRAISEDLAVVTEVQEPGGERRIVRLHDMKEFERPGETAGLIDEILGRLQLHISIGEAY